MTTPSYPFVGVPTFLRAPLALDRSRLDADIAIIGAPTDEGSPFLPGSRLGPRGIREHSLRFVSEEPGVFDPSTGRRLLAREMAGQRIADLGDATVLPTNVPATFDAITGLVMEALSHGALPVVLGGDHAISYPVARAFSEPFDVIHFDAHLDYAPFLHGVEFSNSHAFRHIRALSTVRTLTQIGIRSLRSTERMLRDTLNDGNVVITMAALVGEHLDLAHIKPDSACYVSLDIDVLDLPLVPGCVSAEPNGLSYLALRDLLLGIAQRYRVIGFDIVEVNPLLDIPTGITSYLAAHLAIEFLGAVCAQPRWDRAHPVPPTAARQ